MFFQNELYKHTPVKLRLLGDIMTKITILDNELWYPAVSSYGLDMPYTDSSNCRVILENNPTPNQMQALLLSNQGRLLYASSGFIAEFQAGEIITNTDVTLVDLLGEQANLRGAYLYAVKHFFAHAPITVSDDLFSKPIYNTWMYAPFDVTEEKVIAYANDILASNLPAGTIIIDDKWCSEYGSFTFDYKKFPQPKAMLAKLRELGFQVMLWLCPYVSFNTASYNECLEKDILLKAESEVFTLKWWNESSACLDLRKQAALDYLQNKLANLMDLGVAGFKFDGGDSMYYRKEHEADLQSYLWAKFAANYDYNELRAEFNAGGLNLFERVADKRHSFDENGIKAIVPAALAMGLGAHPFMAADMIGGGEVKDLMAGIKHDKNLFLSHMQIAALFPNVQFSILPKQILGEDAYLVNEILQQRAEIWPYYNKLIQEVRVTKEPILRLLEYVFPHAGLGHITNYFMLGDKYLVAPTDLPNQTEIKLHLPSGMWQCEDKKYIGDKTITLKANYRKLCILERVE